MTDEVAVVIASAGRPELLADVVANVDRLRYDRLTKIVSVPDEASLPAHGIPANWTVVKGVRGSAAQRNAALDRLEGTPVVFFFDDDSVIRDDYIEWALTGLRSKPDLVGGTGRVLLDGATTEEIGLERAMSALATSTQEVPTGRVEPHRELYGCNFFYDMAAAPDLRFDDRLPLYSWLEDHDFARRLMRVGQLARVDDCVIVHRAAGSGGRAAHVRLGYSQVMNPIYLWRKRSFPVWLMLQQLLRPFLKNLALSVASRHRAWRRQRVKGNLLACADAARGRITPERITAL